jgi:hypothetical protein
VNSPDDTHGRSEDAVLASLENDAAVFSDIAGAVAVIAAHQPNIHIRRELRIILKAIHEAREIRKQGLAVYKAKRGKHEQTAQLD